MRSLVLIGHGSHEHAQTARATQQAAETLRARGVFTEVTEGYWQQEPSLRQVLKTTVSSDVTVIPMFLMEGYITETLLPRELGLGFQGSVPPGGVARVIGGRSVRYTRPYGVHPAMQDVILARVHEVLPEGEEADTTLLLIGQAAPPHAEALRERGLFAGVHAFPLAEVPRIAEWREQLGAGRVVVVPFLTAPHPELPEQLGMADLGADERANLHLTEPVGTHPLVAEVLLQVAEEGRDTAGGGDLDQPHAAAWSALLGAAQLGLRLGEVMVTPFHGLYELRHMLDEGRAVGELQTVVTPEGLRDLTTSDDAGRYRPVRTWRNLPRGWRAVLSEQDLPLGVHLLYPAVVEESHAYQHHNLHCTPWASTARRQTGSFTKVQRATPQQVDEAVARVCAFCLKTPLWNEKTLGQTFLAGVPGGLPCAEACTYLVKTIRDEVAQSS